MHVKSSCKVPSPTVSPVGFKVDRMIYHNSYNLKVTLKRENNRIRLLALDNSIVTNNADLTLNSNSIRYTDGTDFFFTKDNAIVDLRIN
ncbi:MAG TPA: hypothetical protein VF691_21025 [Cytophagaceae bacterium]